MRRSIPTCAMHRAAGPALEQLTAPATRNRTRTCAWRTPMLAKGQVWIHRRGADRIRRGHVWIYRSDVLQMDNVEGGAIVTVREEKNRDANRDTILGKAFYSSKSQIALRLLARGDAQIDEQFFRQRFQTA